MKARITGELAELHTMIDLLKAVEHLQTTGELLPVLRDSRLRILETSRPYKNRGDSELYRVYIEGVVR
jgi:hypothetical protein